MRWIVFVIAPMIGLLLVAPLWGQGNWPEYRGPAGNGHIANGKIPIEFSATQNIRWKTPIHGMGWSSPVIWEDQVWLTTATEDGKKMYGICVDLNSGKIIHDKLIHENAEPRFRHPTNSYASCTPAIEKDRVYLHFGSYGTSCLDSNTGEILWQRTDLECDHFRGPGSSPILHGDHLIVALDGFDLQYVVALDKKTGATVWKTDREIDYGTDNGDWKKAYGTGAVFDVQGKTQLVFPSAKATIAYQPETGKPIWTVYHDGMNASARPIMTRNGMVVLTNGMGRMDLVDPNGTGDITKSNIQWTVAKNVAKRPSPIVVGDRIYMFNDTGIASCVNLLTGESIWQQRIGGSFAASPIFDGEHIVACNEQGEVLAFRPDDNGLTEVAKIKLGNGFKASPAVAGSRLILRSLSDLYCVSDQP